MIFNTTLTLVPADVVLKLAGDIQSNPGPLKNPCGPCHLLVARTDRALWCNGCFNDIHIKCGDVTPEQYIQQNGQNIPHTMT